MNLSEASGAMGIVLAFTVIWVVAVLLAARASRGQADVDAELSRR